MATSDKLLSVLDLFDLERPDWSVEEAARALALPTSTAYRYVSSLTRCGLLAPLGTARYILGPTILRYDRQLRLTDPLISAARVEMDAVAKAHPGTVVFLCRLIGRQVMCVHQASVGEPSFATSYERGRLMPLYAGSASKSILAGLPSRQVRPMFEREPQAFAAAGMGDDWKSVKSRLRAIRAGGVVVTQGEIDAGMRGLSVVIADEARSILASLSLVAPEESLDASAVAAASDALRRAAAKIGEILKSEDSPLVTSEAAS